MDWLRDLFSCWTLGRGRKDALLLSQVLCFAVIGLHASSAVAMSSSSPETLDYPAVLQRVRAASIALQRSGELQKSALANESAVRSQSMPTLQLSNSLTAQYSNPSKQQHSLLIGATLWDFGRQSAQEMRASAQRLISDAQSLEAEEALRIRTARFYIAACGAEAVLAVAQEQLRNAESKLKTVTASYQRGERPQADVVKLKVDLGKAQLFYKKSQDEAAWMRAQVMLPTLSLKDISNAANNVRFQLLKIRTPQQWQSFLSQWVKAPIEPAVMERLRSAKIALESEIESLNAEAFPVLSGSAGLQGVGSLSPLKPDVLMQIQMQYSLPLSSIRAQKKESLLARVRENLLSREEEIKTRTEKLVQSQLKIESLLQQVELQKAQISLLLEYQKLVRARYFAGRASLLELTNTEDELLSYKLELTRIELSLFGLAVDASEAVGGKDLEKLF